MPINALWSASLVLLGVSWGCAVAPLPDSPPPSAPFLRATSEDTAQLAMLATDLDIVAHDCTSTGTCSDEMHFSRALVSLFENREAARASFEQLIALHPSSPLAGPSALWLQILHDEGISSLSNDPQRRILAELSAHWAREWIGRRFAVSPKAGMKKKVLSAFGTQSLQKQLQEKERHINELRFQLDALKLIEQDQQDRHRKPKLPKIEPQR